MVQKVDENIENHVYINFRNKNFLIAQDEPTPTVDISKFLWEQIFDLMSNH